MYDDIQKALCTAQSKIAPHQNTEENKQTERWVEHGSDLYSRQNTVTSSALDAIDCLPPMDELDADSTINDLNKAIDSLAAGQAHGNEGIPPT